MHQIYVVSCQNKRTKRKYLKWGYTADSVKRRLGRLKATYKNLRFGRTQVVFEVRSPLAEQHIFQYLEYKGLKPIYKKEFYGEESLLELDNIMNMWHRPQGRY
jgi:hypothetical protein